MKKRMILPRFFSVILVGGMILFSVAIPQAHATVWDDLSNGTQDLFSLVTNAIIIPAKTTFCSAYTSNVQSGSLQPGGFLINFGAKICNSTISSATTSVKQSASLVPVASPINQVSLAPTATFVAPTTTEPVSSALISNPTDSGTTLSDPQIFYWTNINRVSQGTNLSQLTENGTLDAIAEIRVKDMFAKQYFEHVSPTGDNVTKEADINGYQYITIGENIALGNFGSSRDLLVAWMNSPGHRANILSPNYSEIGIAAEQGTYQGQQVWIAAQIFGRPLSDCPEPDASLKDDITSGTATAGTMLTNLTTMKSEINSYSVSNFSDYNTLVSQYNTAAQTYNTLVAQLKTETATYNSEAAAFNSCIQQK